MPISIRVLALLIAASWLTSHHAQAACSSPPGDAADQFYNTTYNVMQYCNGTNWVNMGTPVLSTSLAGLSDVDTTGVSNGNCLVYNSGTSKWEDGSCGSGADNLGNHTATTDLSMASYKITNVTDPTSAQDAATKAYVDSLMAGAGTKGFYVAQSSTSIPTATYTNLTFSGTPVSDFGAGAWNNTTFTVPAGEGGWYNISGTAHVPGGDYLVAAVVVNGSIVGVTRDFSLIGGSNAYVGVSINRKLNAGDAVTLQAYQISGVTKTAGVNSVLSLVKIGGSGGGGSGGGSADNLGAGGTTTGTLYSNNTSGYGYVGGQSGTTGSYLRFDGTPATSAGRIYTNLLGMWEYVTHPDYFGPYATNVNDLGTTGVRWADGWFAGTVTAATFAGSGASLTSLPAANLTGTLPAISGANLTSLNASNLGSGTVPAARMPALTGDVTMAAGTTTTAIAASAVTTTEILDGTIAAADIAASAVGASEIADASIVATTELSATGTKNSTTFLRGDNTWAVPTGGTFQVTTATTALTGGPISYNGTATCPATYLRTGCSVGDTVNSGSDGTSARPSGSDSCICWSNMAKNCYAYCARIN